MLMALAPETDSYHYPGMPKRSASGSRPLSTRVQVAFGRRLKELRTGKASQLEVAEALGVTRSSVSNIENGRHRVFLDQLYAAAELLGVGPAELLPAPEAVAAQQPIHATRDLSEQHHPELARMAYVVREKYERQSSKPRTAK